MKRLIALIAAAVFVVAACGSEVVEVTPAPTAVATPVATIAPTATPEPVKAVAVPTPAMDQQAYEEFTTAATGGPEWEEFAADWTSWTDSDTTASANQVFVSASKLLEVIEAWPDVRMCFLSYWVGLKDFVTAGRDAALAASVGDEEASLAALRAVQDVNIVELRDEAHAWCYGLPAPEAVTTPAPTPVVEKARTIKARGTANTKPFTLAGGDYTFKIKGKATNMFGGNVIVDLTLVDGGVFDYETLWNEIVDKGSYSFTTNVYDLDPGKYYLEGEIMPGGAWAVTITPLK